MKLFIRKPSLFSVPAIILIAILLPGYSFAQSDVCATPTALNSSGTACGGGLTGQTLLSKTQSSPNVGTGTCGGTAGADVWFSFVAQSTSPTITLSNIGNSLRTAGTRVQVMSNACTGATLLACSGSTTTPLSVTPTGLTINQTYLVRVFTPTVAPTTGTWGFDICITNAAPSNDNCSGAITLTSALTCATPVVGNLGPASNSSVTIGGVNCATTVFDDVWYKFTAQTTNPTISLGNMSGFANPGMQLLDNNCGGTFTSLFCGTTSIAADFLTPGSTYYIRVYSTTNITGSAAFDICVTDPVSTPPGNDDCVNAANLPVYSTCTNLAGNMAGATPSTTTFSGCTGPLGYDVWYRFTAINASVTITMSNLGTNFTNPRLQLLSGTCATSFTSLACGTTSLTYGSLTAGTVYYIRVYSTTLTPPNGNARFDICLTSSAAPTVRFGNSYVNITRKTTGGAVQPGDILEIRMSILDASSTTMSRLRFVDNVPSKTTMETGASDRIRIITNEGLFYKQYTLASDGDAATYKASPGAGEYNIRMNIGFGSTPPGANLDNTATTTTNTGSMVNTNKPTLWGGSVIFATAYRVKVTGAVGDTIVLNAAKFMYREGSTDYTLTATPFKILITDPLTLCTNSIGVSNAAESNGTFGTGATLNRTNDLAAPIVGYSFLNNVSSYNSLNDGSYAIVKNISPRNSTNRNANFIRACGTLAENDLYNCNKRMHGGNWYIDGDHTGTSNAIGNTPPDATTSGGYMLMVNADYVASEIYNQTLTNLCPNTYYEFSAWFRNICPTCGADSTGAQRTGSVTAPAAGYPGVYPNMTFSLNGLDYYNTGEIDTVGWVKKGFVFKTDTAQTTAILSIRNNAQGGGGNDLVIDDIAVATCFPNMKYSPSSNPNICRGNSQTITDTVRSYFDNYIYYKWQKWTAATSGPWTDIPGTTGTATPTLVGGLYEYVSVYTIPNSETAAANDGDMYRLVVASKVSNLSSATCSYSDPTAIELNILPPCGPPLKADLLSVTGQLVNNAAQISWVTSKEDEPVYFIVEKSIDGRNFLQIATVNGYNDLTTETNHYVYNDPAIVNDKVYYRIIMVNSQTSKKYSKVIQLSRNSNGYNFNSVVNPFSTELQYDLSAAASGIATIELIDSYGRTIRSEKKQVRAGANAMSITNTNNIPAGVYVLRASINGNEIVRKVVKE